MGRPLVMALATSVLMVLGACAAEPGDTTTTQTPPTSTTVPPEASTTERSSVVDDAEGSGCTPGPGALPDGEWYGYVVAAAEGQVEFDLACWFTGEAAVRAAEEDGEESPPPNDYYVRNSNQVTRLLDVASDAEVIWYPELGDPTSETTTTYSDWIVEIDGRAFMPGIWAEIEGGSVVRIKEQWVP